MNIGTKIRAMRKASGMSQMKMAEQMGITYQQIQKYEKGGNRISVPRLLQISEIFRVSITSFLMDDSMDSDSLKKSQQSALTEDELTLLGLFRRIKSKSDKTSSLEINKRLVKLVEGK